MELDHKVTFLKDFTLSNKFGVPFGLQADQESFWNSLEGGLMTTNRFKFWDIVLYCIVNVCPPFTRKRIVSLYF